MHTITQQSSPMAISLLVPLFFITLLLSTSLAKTYDTPADEQPCPGHGPTVPGTGQTRCVERQAPRAVQAQCLEQERSSLLEWRNQLGFSSYRSSVMEGWNETGNCCSWEGVTCNSEGRVMSLDLTSQGISGRFNESSALFKLEYLEDLYLSYNDFSGSLPSSIGNLERLTDLSLSRCSFTGPIPLTLSNLTRLRYVDLSYNFFSGSISSIHFEALSNIVEMDLSTNSLSGTIPMSLFTLPSLSQLLLPVNQLSGQVSEFPTVNISTELFNLDLSSNRLEGHIPNSIFNLRGLRYLHLSHNLFNHTFRLEKILTIPKLIVLDLSSNYLSLDTTNSSSSPNNFPVKQSSLNMLDLSNNKIGGEIPSWIWEIGDESFFHLNLSCNILVDLQKPYNTSALHSLVILDLHSNQLRGETPPLPGQAWYVDYSNNNFEKFSPIAESFSNCSLEFLSVANNSLSAPFPAFICNCTNLKLLDMSVNNFSGSIPDCVFQNFKDLQKLNLGGNNIGGRIPDKISTECNLRTLELGHNNLVGEVPVSLENCNLLAVMNVGNNRLEDDFPCMLPSSLQLLVLRSNRFHGEVRCRNKSWPNLQIIDISSNNFSGYLNPFNFSSWGGMMLDSNETLQLDPLGSMIDWSYYYRDEVELTIKAVELKLVKIRPEFTSIDFSCNNFHGNIPEAIGELYSLYLLNLSHNSLTGPVPKSFGKLRQLGSLDLSMNQLTGEIPKEIAGLTFLQVMNVSHNKLVGKIPVGPQIQTFSADSFEGNMGLCGLPLKISCINTSNPSLPDPGNVESEREIKWEYVFAAAGYAVGLGSFSWLLLFCRSFRYKYFEKIEDVFDEIFYRCKHNKIRARRTRAVKIRSPDNS